MECGVTMECASNGTGHPSERATPGRSGGCRALPTSDATGRTTQTVRVLLIDDQRFVADVLGAMLSDETDMDFHYCEDPGFQSSSTRPP